MFMCGGPTRSTSAAVSMKLCAWNPAHKLLPQHTRTSLRQVSNSIELLCLCYLVMAFWMRSQSGPRSTAGRRRAFVRTCPDMPIQHVPVCTCIHTEVHELKYTHPPANLTMVVVMYFTAGNVGLWQWRGMKRKGMSCKAV